MFTSRKQTADYQSKIIKQLEAAPDVKILHFWSEFEDDILRKFYFKKDHHLIAKLLNRSIGGVKCRANRLGLRLNK
ncbi:MAG TPA: hypothetical protein PLC32_04205 [Candidatus Omnitrophota bacterium]|nr:hypothetical protein [Candidatus Omnitrophota bacterium]